jgi:hypothetical protein
MLSPDFHDMTIRCGRNVEFPCHKAIVYAQSKKIRWMCRQADVGEVYSPPFLSTCLAAVLSIALLD